MYIVVRPTLIELAEICRLKAIKNQILVPTFLVFHYCYYYYYYYYCYYYYYIIIIITVIIIIIITFIHIMNLVS